MTNVITRDPAGRASGVASVEAQLYAAGRSYHTPERTAFASALLATDRALGLVVDALVDAGMLGDATAGAKRAEANGVLVVHSDNGGDTEYNKGHPGNNFPLRSEKFAYYEGGIRVPAFVFAPGLLDDTRKGSTFHGLMVSSLVR